jgi:very-short-patch-repair endonuclease
MDTAHDPERAPMGRPTGLAILIALAAPTFGWFRSRDAVARGVSPSTLTRLRSRRIIHTPSRGLNWLTCFPDTWEGRAIAALWSAGSHAALARWAALRLLRNGSGSPAIDLVVPRHVTVTGTATHLRQHARLAMADVVSQGGFRFTSAAFTVCDLAPLLPVGDLVRIADRFVAERIFELDELAAMVRRFRAIEGVETLREMLTQLDPASRWTRSDGERAWARLLRAAGVPTPVANARVIDADGRRRYLDFAWPDLRVAVELDLHPSHGTTVGRRNDGTRQNALVLNGWTVLRFDLADVMSRPDHVIRTVRQAIAQATA